MTTLEEPKQLRPSEPVYDVEQGVDLEKPLSEQPKSEETRGLSKLGRKSVEAFETKQKEPETAKTSGKASVHAKRNLQRAYPQTVTTTEEVFEPELPPELQGIEGGKVDLSALQSISPNRSAVEGLNEIPHPSLNTIQRQIAQLANANKLPSLWGMDDTERDASEIVATKIVGLARQAKQISPDLDLRAFISNAQGVDGSRDAESYLTAIEDEIYGTALKNELFETHDNTRGASLADNQIHEELGAIQSPVTKFENEAGLEYMKEETAYGDNYAEYKPEKSDKTFDSENFDVLSDEFKDSILGRDVNFWSGKHERNSKAEKSSRLEKKLKLSNERLGIARMKNAVRHAEETAKALA